MSANNLLLLLSAKTQGSWSQFRGAVEKLHIAPNNTGSPDDVDGEDFPLYQQLRLNLERLAHVEFRTNDCRNGWRVTPPTLALVHRGGQPPRGVLCGARSRGLLERIVGGANGGLVATTLDDAPDRITITAEHTGALRQLADEVGVYVQDDAPTTLLAALAPIGLSNTKKSELSFGPDWQIHCFSASEHRWTEASTEAALVGTGLFRFQLGYQRFYYYCNAGAAYEISVQVGKYIALRRHRKDRQQVVLYDHVDRSLSVPRIFRPPMLIERALILCSGSLPEYDHANKLLKYADIPPTVYRLAAQLLHQEAA